MDMQNVSNLEIPEGEVRTIHDKDNRLLWGRVHYDTKYAGDTYQQTYTGKNLFKSQNADYNGIITTLNSDGSITCHGTTATNYFNICPYQAAFANYLKAGTYTFSRTGFTNRRLQIQLWNADKSQQLNIVIDANTDKSTATLEFDAYYYGAAYTQLSSGMAIDFTTKIQLESGNQATDFEPYVGGTASPNPDYPQDINVVTGEQTVKVTGKNLMPPLTNGTITGNSQTFSNARITIKQAFNYTKELTYTDGVFSGTPTQGTGSYYIWYATITGLEANTQYTISVDYSVTLTEVSNFIAIGSIKASAPVGTSTGKFSKTITTDANGEYAFSSSGNAFINAYLNNNQTTTFTLSNLQIEQGDQASSFEPYQEQTYTIDLQGKNLLDMGTLIDGYVTATGTFETNHPQDEMRSGFIKIAPNTTYTFSIIETTSTWPSWFGVGEYSSAIIGSFIRRDTNTTTTATSITFTTSATTHYIVVSARNMAGATKVQVEKGSTTTSFAPFTSTELAKIGTYQDYIYKSGDDWYVHKATNKTVLSSSSFESTIYTVGGLHCLAVPLSDKPRTSSNGGLCNMASNIRASSPLWAEGCFYENPANFLFSGDMDDTVNEIKAKYNGALLYYALATPTDTQITDETLIGELEAIHEWLVRYGYYGTVSGNLPMIIDRTNL